MDTLKIVGGVIFSIGIIYLIKSWWEYHPMGCMCYDCIFCDDVGFETKSMKDGSEVE